MPRRRIGKSAKCPTYPVQLRQAIGRFLPRRGLATLPGNGKLRWSARLLAICAVLTAWSPEPTLGDRFGAARGVLVGMFPTRRRPGGTYAGFIAALARASASLLAVVVPHLRGCVRRLAVGASSWEVSGWAVFGVDGSKVDVPMTQANEDALGVASRKRAGPQMLLTVLFHVGSGLVWAWRRGVAKASERPHLLHMLDTAPGNALLLADAGFTGYDLLKSIIAGNRSFLIRVGSNVRLLTKLGYRVREFDDGLVWLWPDGARGKGLEPLTLRLITVDGGRRGTLYLLTDVLDPTRLSDPDAGRLYAMRWGVELLYRSLKQTMRRRKMPSGSPAHAVVELDWSVVGLWVLGLANAEASGDVRRASVAQTLRRVRAAMAGRGGNLRAALAGARRDDYRRHRAKAARHWPHKKREKRPGAPKARTATEAEVLQAQRLAERLAAA